MNEEERKKLIDGLKAAIAEGTGKTDKMLLEIEGTLKAQKEISDVLKTQFAEQQTKNQELAGELADLKTKLATMREPGLPSKGDSNGAAVIKSQGWLDFVKNGGRGKSVGIEVKTITSLPASGGNGIWSDRLQGIVVPPLRQFTIRDLLSPGRTTSNLIEWIKELVFTNAADVVSEGALKPQSNITYAREDVPVRTVAHWIRATRQVLSDFPQLQTLIDGRLTYGLKIVEENQLLLGDGIGGNLLGLIPQATAYNNNYNRAGDTFIDVIRHAILQVRLSFYPATGIVLSPIDWHTIELTKDNQNRYMMANPASNLPAMLWGRPVVESDAMPEDNFLVGSFALGATVFDREDAQIFVSTEDQDNFVKNLVTILCEERLALAVARPAAFVHGGFPSGSTT